MRKLALFVAGVWVALAVMLAFDADTGKPPSCAGTAQECGVTPAPHANPRDGEWEVKGP